MALVAEREPTQMGATQGCADHDHDLIHELSRRLDSLWRYDQYIANADWRDELREFWREMKDQEEANIARMKELVKKEIANDCF